MIYTLPIVLIFCTGCQGLKTFAPTIGGGIGAGVGSLGGPGPAIIAGSLGAGAGQIYKEVSQNEKAQKTLEALSHGDVSALVAQGMEEHKTGFEAFTSYIKKILIGAAIVLAGYLAIPIFVAKRCAKSEVTKSATRAPFPVKPPSRNEKS